MSYGKVKESFWTDRKVRSFSDDAKMLALYLLTGPHRNILGCMRVPDGYLLEDMGWPAKRLSDAVKVLVSSGFIARDDEGWTLILNQLRHDPIAKTPNHIKAAVAVADSVPSESPVYLLMASRFVANLNAINMASAWHPHAIDIPEPLPEPEPEPAPEPERVTSPAATAPVTPPETDLALEAYNAAANRVGWPIAQRLTDARRRGLTARLAECGGSEGFALALLKAEQSDFLAGRTARTSGHENWTPTIDFFLQPKTFTKLMEGGYDNKSSGKPTEPQSDYQRALARLKDRCRSDYDPEPISEARDGSIIEGNFAAVRPMADTEAQ